MEKVEPIFYQNFKFAKDQFVTATTFAILSGLLSESFPKLWLLTFSVEQQASFGMCPQLEEHNRLPGGDLINVGNFTGVCSVSTAPLQGSFPFFSFFEFSYIKRSVSTQKLKNIVSLFIHLCTDVYCEPGIRHQCSKGSSRWPPIPHNANQSETIFLLFLSFKNECMLKLI